MRQKNIGFEDRITDEHKALVTEFLDRRTERHKFAMTMVYKNWRMCSIKVEHILQFLFDKKELGQELSFLFLIYNSYNGVVKINVRITQ